MTLALIILGAVLIIALIFVVIYNGLVRLRNKTDESWSGIDVQLKRRHDLVPNLVATVKRYATHEQATLEAVIAARTAATSASSPEQAAASESILGQMLGKVFALGEAYPDLKANTNFLELQTQLAEIEDELAASRRIYNGNVAIYNTKIQQVPSNIVAGIGNFTVREFFEIEDSAERVPVQVSF